MTTNSAGLSGAKPTRMLTMPQVDVVLRRGLLVALDEVRLARRRALEGALAEQRLHERADVEPDLGPERLVVRLEHRPLGAAVQRSPRGRARAGAPGCTSTRRPDVGAVERARAPGDGAEDREGAQAVDAERVERAVLGIGQHVGELVDVAQRRSRCRPAPSRRRGRCRCGRTEPAIVPLGAKLLSRPSSRGSGSAPAGSTRQSCGDGGWRPPGPRRNRGRRRGCRRRPPGRSGPWRGALRNRSRPRP